MSADRPGLAEPGPSHAQAGSIDEVFVDFADQDALALAARLANVLVPRTP